MAGVFLVFDDVIFRTVQRPLIQDKDYSIKDSFMILDYWYMISIIL